MTSPVLASSITLCTVVGDASFVTEFSPVAVLLSGSASAVVTFLPRITPALTASPPSLSERSTMTFTLKTVLFVRIAAVYAAPQIPPTSRYALISELDTEQFATESPVTQ